MDPLISVIVPVYNMEAYLARCLDSVLCNSYRNLEVICVDDGSKDRSLELLRAYEVRDKRIVVIAKENGGVSSARNAGLDCMNGNYFSFVDPDDFVHPQYFELLLQAIESTGSDISFCDFQTVEDKDLPLHSAPFVPQANAFRILNRAQVFKNHQYRSYVWGRLMKTPLCGSLRFREDLSYAEDAMFFAAFAEEKEALSASVVPAALYYYYQREESLAKQAKLPQQLKIAEICVDKLLKQAAPEEVFLDQAVKRCLSVWYLSSHILPDRAIAKTCRQWLRPCGKRLRASSLFSAKEKLLYSLFSWCPQFYWLYRSITQPDMWAWEKAERKKRRCVKTG